MIRYLGNKEKKEINKNLIGDYFLGKKDEIIEDSNIIYKNKKKYLLIIEKNKKEILKVVPHLKSICENNIKSVYIDNGAIPFLIKGADMMRPGIVKIENGINFKDIIFICDFEHKKILGIGEAVNSSKKMQIQKNGIAVKTIHYMGDKFY